jgi:valyl-tRNA synthetase
MGGGFPAYGADALRLTLCSYSPQAKRIALSPKRIEGYRNFCNKIYNAVRFSLPHIESAAVSAGPPAHPKLLINKWILSRLGTVVEQASRSIGEFRLDEGSGALYHFFWDELCDWFVEMTKPVFSATLAHVIEASLRALHPFAPFLTEELWQRVPRPPGRPVSIAFAAYPTASEGRADGEAEQAVALLMRVITAARAIRSDHDVHPGARVPLLVRSSDARIRETLQAQAAQIEFLARTQGPVVIEASGGERPRGSVLGVAGDAEVLVGLRGLVDAKKERERVERRLAKLDKDLSTLKKRLENSAFVDKAPREVVAEARAQAGALTSERSRLAEALTLADELE